MATLTPPERTQLIKDTPLESEYPLTLRSERIILQRKNVPLDALRLDPKNQRVQFLMASQGFSLTDQEIEAELWKEDYVRQLADSIMYNGGLLAPLIIKPDGTVVEGNSRLVALRHLKKRAEKDKIAPPPDVLAPLVEVLPEEFDDKRLLWLLGEWHIVGKHDWDPYEQAEFIYRLWTEEGQTYENLVSHLRMSKSTIRQKLDGYEMMSRYLADHRSPGEIHKWSYFEEFCKKKELKEYREQDPTFEQEFFDLVADGGKGFEGMNVRKLPEILLEPKAWQTLKQTKNFRAAYAFVEAKKAKSHLHQVLVNCHNSLEGVEVKEIFNLQQAIKADPEHPTAAAMRQLYDKLMSFGQLIGVKFD